MTTISVDILSSDFEETSSILSLDRTGFTSHMYDIAAADPGGTFNVNYKAMSFS